MGENIMSDNEKLIEAMAGYTEDFLELVSLLIEISGWDAMFEILQKICWERNEGYIAGVLKAAQTFIKEKKKKSVPFRVFHKLL